MSSIPASSRLEEIKAAIFARRKIEAIRLYRESIPSSLAHAKAAVEKLEAELRTSAPERFGPAPVKIGGGGCLLIVAIAVAVGVGLLAFMTDR